MLYICFDLIAFPRWSGQGFGAEHIIDESTGVPFRALTMPNPELKIVFTPPCPGIKWSDDLLEAQFFTVLAPVKCSSTKKQSVDRTDRTDVMLTGNHQNRVTGVFLEYVGIGCV